LEAEIFGHSVHSLLRISAWLTSSLILILLARNRIIQRL
jgi:hypothetical protein